MICHWGKNLFNIRRNVIVLKILVNSTKNFKILISHRFEISIESLLEHLVKWPKKCFNLFSTHYRTVFSKGFRTIGFYGQCWVSLRGLRFSWWRKGFCLTGKSSSMHYIDEQTAFPCFPLASSIDHQRGQIILLTRYWPPAWCPQPDYWHWNCHCSELYALIDV